MSKSYNPISIKRAAKEQLKAEEKVSFYLFIENIRNIIEILIDMEMTRLEPSPDIKIQLMRQSSLDKHHLFSKDMSYLSNILRTKDLLGYSCRNFGGFPFEIAKNILEIYNIGVQIQIVEKNDTAKFDDFEHSYILLIENDDTSPITTSNDIEMGLLQTTTDNDDSPNKVGSNSKTATQRRKIQMRDINNNLTNNAIYY